MRKLILLFTLLIASVYGSSQGLCLPSSAIDTIIWKLRVGAACDSLQKAQFAQILALQSELMATGKIVRIQKEQIGLQESMLLGRTRELEANRQIWRSEKRGLIKQNNRLKWVIAGESGVIVLILLLLL